MRAPHCCSARAPTQYSTLHRTLAPHSHAPTPTAYNSDYTPDRHI